MWRILSPGPDLIQGFGGRLFSDTGCDSAGVDYHRSDQRAEINFALEVGGVTERIEVEAAVTQLNTTDGSQGQVIDNRRMIGLPLNGRSYDDLALLASSSKRTRPVHGNDEPRLRDFG